jgi:hypothetical protein
MSQACHIGFAADADGAYNKGYSDLSLLGLRCQETQQLAMVMP